MDVKITPVREELGDIQEGEDPGIVGVLGIGRMAFNLPDGRTASVNYADRNSFRLNVRNKFNTPYATEATGAKALVDLVDYDSTGAVLEDGTEDREADYSSVRTGLRRLMCSLPVPSQLAVAAINPSAYSSDDYRDSILPAIAQGLDPRQKYVALGSYGNKNFQAEMEKLGFERVTGQNFFGREEKMPPFFVGKVEDGTIVPANFSRETLDQASRLALFRFQQFSNGTSRRRTERELKVEDQMAIEAEKIEDKLFGRKPKRGVVKPDKEWENLANDWAQSQGFDLSQGANGFSREATRSHDVAHPIAHEMLGMDSRSIHKELGGINFTDGKPTLVGEEAIVNIIEHLSRGDDIESSITNGIRLARVLVRNQPINPEFLGYISSQQFRDQLTDMAEKVFRNDNYNDYMKVVRKYNRIAGTVTQSGNDFTNTASGG